MNRKPALLTLVLIILMGCADNTKKGVSQCNDDWQLIFKNDKEGKAIHGSKTALLKAVLKGYPVRIGWASRRADDTTKSVEHFTNAAFLTIANSKELFAQIEPIIGQNPILDGDSLAINFRERFRWVMMVGSNGFSDRLTLDALNDSIIGHRNLPTEVSWFVQRNISLDSETVP